MLICIVLELSYNLGPEPVRQERMLGLILCIISVMTVIMFCSKM